MKKEHWLIFAVIVFAVFGFYFDEVMMSPEKMDLPEDVEARYIFPGQVPGFGLPEATGISPVKKPGGITEDCVCMIGMTPEEWWNTGVLDYFYDYLRTYNCWCDCVIFPPEGEPGPPYTCVMLKAQYYSWDWTDRDDRGSKYNGKWCTCEELVPVD